MSPLPSSRPSGFLGPALFLLASPLLVFLIPLLLVRLLPDDLYYTPLTFYIGYYEITPLTLLVPLFAWPFFMKLGRIYGRTGNRLIRLSIAMIAVPLVAFVWLCFTPSSFNTALFYNIATNARLAPGHPMCFDPLLESLERCEGHNRGFMQLRLYAVAHYGEPVAGFDAAVKAVPQYNMYEVPCTDLVGGTVGRCYTGHYATDTGDNYYKNVYLFNRDGKALILNTANIVITTGDLERQQRHDTPSAASLDDFVDLSRFNPN